MVLVYVLVRIFDVNLVDCYGYYGVDFCDVLVKLGEDLCLMYVNVDNCVVDLLFGDVGFDFVVVVLFSDGVVMVYVMFV